MTNRPMSKVNGIVKSVKRTMELFEYLSECRHPVTVTNIVHVLGYPQSSASALLRSLSQLGYLSFDRYRRTYQPTLRIALSGGWVQDELFSHESLSHLIDGLYIASNGANVILAMQNGIYAQYIYLRQSKEQYYIKPGSLRPLCRSATGRILLSRKTDEEIRKLLWRINAQEDQGLRTRYSDLIECLNRVRECGYAYTEGTVTVGAGVIAVEMPTSSDQPLMALGLGGNIDDIRRKRERYHNLLTQTLVPYWTLINSRSRLRQRQFVRMKRVNDGEYSYAFNQYRPQKSAHLVHDVVKRIENSS